MPASSVCAVALLLWAGALVPVVLGLDCSLPNGIDWSKVPVGTDRVNGQQTQYAWGYSLCQLKQMLNGKDCFPTHGARADSMSHQCWNLFNTSLPASYDPVSGNVTLTFREPLQHIQDMRVVVACDPTVAATAPLSLADPNYYTDVVNSSYTSFTLYYRHSFPCEGTSACKNGQYFSPLRFAAPVDGQRAEWQLSPCGQTRCNGSRLVQMEVHGDACGQLQYTIFKGINVKPTGEQVATFATADDSGTATVPYVCDPKATGGKMIFGGGDVVKNGTTLQFPPFYTSSVCPLIPNA